MRRLAICFGILAVLAGVGFFEAGWVWATPPEARLGLVLIFGGMDAMAVGIVCTVWATSR